MNRLLYSRRSSQRPGEASRLVGLIACLLIAIHFFAGYVCMTCTYPTDKPNTRNFHLHSGGDRDPCHHGKAKPDPLTTWACAVTEDEDAFVLPEIPRLPVIVSVFVPLIFLLVSYRNTFLIAAHGRGPPLRAA